MSTLRTLNACGCCKGTAIETPGKVWNRPGLSAIAYRAGTHPEFKSSMLARLSAAGLGALQGLRTRDDGDFSVSLLDAFATVADVLTFYQERIAQESYLRTATERRSVLELARLIGYELDPGVASSVHLAFTIDDAPGAFGRALSVTTSMPVAPEEPPTVTIPVGTKVQTVPGPDELPQMFETVEEIGARAKWNAMKPRLVRAQTVRVDMPHVWLEGITHNLKRGDRVVISVGITQGLRTVRSVDLKPDDKRMQVVFDAGVAGPLTATMVVYAMAPEGAMEAPPPPSGDSIGFMSNVDRATTVGESLDVESIDLIKTMSFSEEELQFLALHNNWNPNAMSTGISQQPHAQIPPPVGDGVFAMRQLASIFGYNAPAVLPPDPPVTVPPVPRTAPWVTDTLEKHAEATSTSQPLRYIYLDRVYDELLPDQWIVLEGKASRRFVKIVEVANVAWSQDLVSGKSTRLRVITHDLSEFLIRETTVLVQADALPLALEPIPDPLERNEIFLGDYYDGLAKGRAIVVSGAPSTLPTTIESEVRTIAESRLEQGVTRLRLDRDLTHSYVRTTVTINANVAFATHGETVSEILGSGDASQPFQRFKLKQPRLTWVGAENGSVSTLRVRVNDVLWEEVPELYGHGPEERIYTIRMDDEGSSYVTFGDGRTGARLPTGDSNVFAVYRRGIGLVGSAKVGQITQLMNKPVGVKGATNPRPAAGAGDWETLADARQNASLTALTLGRVVSLRDYEDFARAFPGIAKAGATWSWSGQRRRILLTVAGDAAQRVEPDSDLGTRLVTGIRNLGDPHVALTLAPHDPLLFYLRLRVKVDPKYLREKVFTQIREKLRKAFSFDARSFGQAVTRGEIVTVVHEVEGVIAVDFVEFYSSEGTAADEVSRIGALPATKNGPARLLTIDPIGDVRLEVMP